MVFVDSGTLRLFIIVACAGLGSLAGCEGSAFSSREVNGSSGAPDGGAQDSAGGSATGGSSSGTGTRGGDAGGPGEGGAGESGGTAVPKGCGDGEIGNDEACDDGDVKSGDGCGADCGVEAGWTCENETGVSLCVELPLPSCDGLSDMCHEESCCKSLPVIGGEMLPLGDESTGGERLTTVDSFRLDKYEVTVGRFSRFVNAYDAWRERGNPAVGAGANPAVGPESGWQAAWNDELPADAAEMTSMSVQCPGSSATWLGSGALPINCVNWYLGFAFCIWDRGRLPSEVEWEYAAAGGEENRTYPWGHSEATADHALYCGECGAGVQILAPGSRPLGVGRFGHLDLGGAMMEPVYDLYDSYPTTVPPNYMALEGPVLERIRRGGNWWNDQNMMQAARREIALPENRWDTSGVRCARPYAGD